MDLGTYTRSQRKASHLPQTDSLGGRGNGEGEKEKVELGP
jgi:hypothetical protein